MRLHVREALLDLLFGVPAHMQPAVLNEKQITRLVSLQNNFVVSAERLQCNSIKRITVTQFTRVLENILLTTSGLFTKRFL